jgi:hypothetical protein
MAALELGLAVADLKIPRMEPCSALVAPRTECGATPASLYHRTCGVDSHGADIWLCPIHAALVAAGAAICRPCAERGGVAQACVYRIIMVPVRLPKKYP